VIIKGTDIIGSFKGKLTLTGAKVEDFKGNPEAKRTLRLIARQCGVRLDDRKKEEDKEWSDSEYYERMNPGAFK